MSSVFTIEEYRELLARALIENTRLRLKLRLVGINPDA